MGFEFAILDSIQGVRCDFLDTIVPVITSLGNKGYIWIAIGLMLCVSRKYRKYGIILLAVLTAGLLVGNVCLKHLVMRPRPCWINDSIDMLIRIPRDYSFPSGHTLSSAGAATVITGADRRFGWVAIPLAVLIAFTRLYLYVHFPTDILAGALIGFGLGMAGLIIGRKVLGD